MFVSVLFQISFAEKVCSSFSLLRSIAVCFTLQFHTCASELKFHVCSLNDSLVSSTFSEMALSDPPVKH